MLDVEEAWEIVGDTIHLYYAPKNIAPEIAAAKIKAAVRAAMLAVLDEALLPERYGIGIETRRELHDRMVLTRGALRARIQALAEGRKEK